MSDFIDRFTDVVAPVISFDNTVEMVEASGAWLTDASGKRYLDFGTGISVTNCGHNHPQIVAAAHKQIDRVWHGGGTFRYDSYVSAAEQLVSVAPEPIDMFFFMNSGAEAVEAGVKLARHTTGRQGIVVFRGGFHGRTMGSVSYTTSSVKYRTGYHPLLPSVFVTPFPHPFRDGLSEEEATSRALHELREMLRHVVAPADIACFLIEPVQGEGGYYPAPATFMQELRDLADRHGILIIADEVQTGFGRTGTWWGIDNYDIQPDILTIGKAIANGLPLSAVGSSKDLFGKWPPGVHGTTFGGNAVACAAAVEVVNVVNEVLPSVPALSEQAFSGLRAMQAHHPTVGDVRGLGLMIGIELVDGDGRPDSVALEFVRSHLLDTGLIFHPCGPDHNIIRFIPPLVISPEDLDHGIALIDDAIGAWESH
ncbi:MAG: aminotransferase class III-fold pyridoxal phosphate-dependent enzyme [Acidimicrobiia bacterium]|nr:aminotransferase class III-fold pyridoxal phosphate-dependent enzyme [Acidimicrobiia bacterium]